MLILSKISKSRDGVDILTEVSFNLGDGQKAALVGANGVGKTTLLKIIAGEIEQDGGTVETGKLPIGYLPQETDFGDLNITTKAYLTRRLDDNYLEHEVKRVFAGFRLDADFLNRTLGSLSGGQRAKVALTAVLLSDPDILLLDEPTNNLDLQSIIWLENYLFSCKATCLIVSHDRRFLDKIIDKVIELDWFDRTASEFTGSYSVFLEQKRAALARERQLISVQERKIERLEDSAKKSKDWADTSNRQQVTDNDKLIRGRKRDKSKKSARASHSIEQQIKQIDKIEPTKQRTAVLIPLVPAPNEAGHRITLENVDCGYDNKVVVESVNLNIEHGARIAITGENGSGKSTLLKTITGELKPLTGTINCGKALVFGYLTQDHTDILQYHTVQEYLCGHLGINKERMYFLLGIFNFRPEDALKPIDKLSPGERARLIIASFVAISANVLLLDEPTNHLDIEGLDALERVLDDYKGTVILVSHDRYFLEKVKPDRIYEVKSGKLIEIL